MSRLDCGTRFRTQNLFSGAGYLQSTPACPVVQLHCLPRQSENQYVAFNSSTSSRGRVNASPNRLCNPVP